MKCCYTCRTEKPLDDFPKLSKSKDGLHYDCKDCKNHKQRERHRANPEIMRDAGKRYAERNRERKLASAKRSREKHKDKRAQGGLDWQRRNPEKVREYNQRWNSSPENRQKKIEMSKAWNKANPEKMRETSKKWRGKNPDAKRASNHRRKYNEKNALGTYTAQEWQDLCNRYGNICLRCKASTQLTVDHVIPIALGGSNSIDNIQPLCMSCNCSKQDTVADYRY